MRPFRARRRIRYNYRIARSVGAASTLLDLLPGSDPPDINHSSRPRLRRMAYPPIPDACEIQTLALAWVVTCWNS